MKKLLRRQPLSPAAAIKELKPGEVQPFLVEEYEMSYIRNQASKLKCGKYSVTRSKENPRLILVTCKTNI